MGRSRKPPKCPRCGSSDVLLQDICRDGLILYTCADCDHDFEVGGSHRRHNHSHTRREIDDKVDGAFEESEWEG